MRKFDTLCLISELPVEPEETKAPRERSDFVNSC
jgi:hypothetical protein